MDHQLDRAVIAPVKSGQGHQRKEKARGGMLAKVHQYERLRYLEYLPTWITNWVREVTANKGR